MKKIYPEEIKDKLVDDLQVFFGDNLLSVVMHGSAVTERYVPGKSDINISCVLKDDSLNNLLNFSVLEKKYSKSNVAFSFFFTPKYITDSVDAYPLEFMEIKQANEILFGEDFFGNLKINNSDLRLQCERELRGKLLHLKREFIHAGGKKKKIANLIKISFPQFLIIFRGVISASDGSYEKGLGLPVCEKLSGILDLQFKALLEIARKGYDLKDHELNDYFMNYVDDIENIIEAVDKSL